MDEHSKIVLLYFFWDPEINIAIDITLNGPNFELFKVKDVCLFIE